MRLTMSLSAAMPEHQSACTKSGIASVTGSIRYSLYTSKSKGRQSIRRLPSSHDGVGHALVDAFDVLASSCPDAARSQPEVDGTSANAGPAAQRQEALMLRSHSMVAGSTSSQSAASPRHLRPGHCNRKARAACKRHMPLRINLQHCRYDIRAALCLNLSKHAPMCDACQSWSHVCQ
jgi:hypothetical protein